MNMDQQQPLRFLHDDMDIRSSVTGLLYKVIKHTLYLLCTTMKSPNLNF